VWHSEAKDDLFDKIHYYRQILSGNWHGFYPLGKFVDYDQHVNVPTWP
jgi:hypothetical protein